MAEYIDKNRLILCMNDWMLQNAPVKAGDDIVRADTILDAIKMVEDSPAANVRENVSGRWKVEVNYQTGIETVSCPNCHIKHTFPIGPGVKVLFTNYCPNCGAQMTGGAEDG